MKRVEFTAREALNEIVHGRLSSEELISDCLRQVDKLEEEIGAWAFIDRTKVIDQARKADTRRKIDNSSILPLDGIPVGIKDIFDTNDMPTENGTTIHAGRCPKDDAAIVRLLREAGALIMGKTVTAELAVYTPGKTKNPHDLTRTPGGSSSGSAAAVAARMVPLAVGTQTNGSVIRPASFCGVVGFKPTFGTIPRAGVLRQAPSLDQVGVFSRNVLDSALLASILMKPEEIYGDTLPLPEIDISLVEKSFSTNPNLGFVRTAVWSEASTITQKSYLDFVNGQRPVPTEIELPSICDQAVSCHRTIMLCEMAHHYNAIYTDNREEISPMLLGMLDEGRRVSLSEYLDAKNLLTEVSGVVDNALKDFDAVITPATPAEAPEGIASTGSPVFCTVWSLTGVPSISLPVLSGESGMPLGLQLVGSRGSDSKLLRGAHWLEKIHYSLND
ncbi:MAG: amidase [Desulfobacterales bacterium]|nr:amidase [Deltaproteobacteria bacterium]NNK94666.1 amidase [Desulfobacterales bacterium]